MDLGVKIQMMIKSIMDTVGGPYVINYNLIGQPNPLIIFPLNIEHFVIKSGTI